MKKKTATTRYDVAEHRKTPEEMAAYLEAFLADSDGDAAFVAQALGDIARAKGMCQVARDAGLSRESLYKALSGERSPDFDTILKVMGALGLEVAMPRPLPDTAAQFPAVSPRWGGRRRAVGLRRARPSAVVRAVSRRPAATRCCLSLHGLPVH